MARQREKIIILLKASEEHAKIIAKEKHYFANGQPRGHEENGKKISINPSQYEYKFVVIGEARLDGTIPIHGWAKEAVGAFFESNPNTIGELKSKGYDADNHNWDYLYKLIDYQALDTPIYADLLEPEKHTQNIGYSTPDRITMAVNKVNDNDPNQVQNLNAWLKSVSRYDHYNEKNVVYENIFGKTKYDMKKRTLN